MGRMGDTFRSRLADGAVSEPLQFPEPKVPMVECTDCRDVIRDDEAFDGMCEHCALEARAEGPMDDWSFARDFRL